ncbi:hypothetical protein BLNAU_14330 [Blattamonas nauphoetae]|uniref:Uncharacterized protein n=1 Tax=Blattamonas nauphoetae TaxID=2049346 RepID=A0ABQ9XG64_9EUKA|nr:hypothetical protein BLNAU_14330 [Blattamonas nauphoetae]
MASEIPNCVVLPNDKLFMKLFHSSSGSSIVDGRESIPLILILPTILGISPSFSRSQVHWHFVNLRIQSPASVTSASIGKNERWLGDECCDEGL